MQPVTLTLTESHITGLAEKSALPVFEVMTSTSSQLIIWGNSRRKKTPKFHVYNMTKEGMTKTMTIDALCDHNRGDCYIRMTFMLPIDDLLAVSCSACGSIRLLDIETKTVVRAFHDLMYRPSVMCLGELEQLIVANTRPPSCILVFRCNDEEFHIEREIADFERSEPVKSICYIPDPRRLIAICRGTFIYALLFDHNHTCGAWNYRHEEEYNWGPLKPVHLSDMVYSYKLKGLLVNAIRSIHVLNPGDGTLRQIIALCTLDPSPEMPRDSDYCYFPAEHVDQENQIVPMHGLGTLDPFPQTPYHSNYCYFPAEHGDQENQIVPMHGLGTLDPFPQTPYHSDYCYFPAEHGFRLYQENNIVTMHVLPEFPLGRTSSNIYVSFARIE